MVTCVCVYMYIGMHTYINTCVYVCVYIYIYIYISLIYPPQEDSPEVPPRNRHPAPEAVRLTS